MKQLQRIFADLCVILWERFVRSLQQRTLFTFFVITVFIIAISAVTFRLAEHDEHESLWRTVVYIVSGLDVDPPQSTFGRAVAAFAVFSGVILVSMLTAFLAAEFSRVMVSAQSVRRKPSEQDFQDHVVIVGWGPKRKEVLRQLNQTWVEQGYHADDIIIIAPEEHLERGGEPIYDHTWHVSGTATDIDALREADLLPGKGRGARIAVVMGDFDASAEDNDRRSLLKLLAIEHLHPDVISLVEVQDSSNREHFNNANADEIVTPYDYASLMLARSAEHRGLASYFDELLALAFAPEEQLGGIIHHPISLYSCTARELQVDGKQLGEAIMSHYERTNDLIAGILTGDKIELFPEIPGGTSRAITSADVLVVIKRGNAG